MFIDFCCWIDYFFSTVKRMNKILILAMWFLFSGIVSVEVDQPRRERMSHGESQFRPNLDRSGLQVWQIESRDIFDQIRSGIVVGVITRFSGYLASQVRITLPGGETGYYSPNQAFYVLEMHFKPRKTLYLEFTSYGESESNPFASGKMSTSVRGAREETTVFASLLKDGGRWMITEITIY